MTNQFQTGDRVIKRGGFYTFEGWVVSVFAKRVTEKGGDGPVRVVVQNSAGMLHIFNPGQLEKL